MKGGVIIYELVICVQSSPTTKCSRCLVEFLICICSKLPSCSKPSCYRLAISPTPSLLQAYSQSATNLLPTCPLSTQSRLLTSSYPAPNQPSACFQPTLILVQSFSACSKPVFSNTPNHLPACAPGLLKTSYQPAISLLQAFSNPLSTCFKPALRVLSACFKLATAC